MYDIISVFLTELHIQNEDDLELVEDLQNKDRDLIIVKRYVK